MPFPARRTVRALGAAALATSLVAACSASSTSGESARAKSVTATPTAQSTPTAEEPGAKGSPDDAVDYVLAISIDGLKPQALRQLGRDGAPNFYRLIDEGATTLNARTEREATITLPNHTGMVTGRWITKKGGHGVLFNDDNGKTVHDSAGEYVKSMFSVVHDHGGSTRMYAAKDKFKFLNRSWNKRYGHRDRVGKDNGRDKIDRFFYKDEPVLVDRLTARLTSHPDELSFLHLAYPDSAGHSQGWMTPAYIDAVKKTDGLLGKILDTVDHDDRLSGHLNIVLTADHGGKGRNHYVATRRADYTIPFMVWGVGVADGKDLYAINKDSRKRPGKKRTTYRGKQPIRNGDVANLVTDLLDMPSVPGSTFNTGQRLDPS